MEVQEVVELHGDENYWEVKTADGQCDCTKAALLTTSAHYRGLGIPGEDEFISDYGPVKTDEDLKVRL